ncbi:hypothetical protein V5799_010786 [Amblyomma americanum]|uniref:Secreted protein n=1 Tax=Amblyomma americanum TaxID=6943 RepID=A0AAQ4EIZ3_AMBAM
MSYRAEFLLNTMFFIIWPVLLCRQRVVRQTPPKYQLLHSTTTSSTEDELEHIRRATSEIFIPIELPDGRKTRSHT